MWRSRIYTGLVPFELLDSAAALSKIHDVTGRRLVSSICSWDIYGKDAGCAPELEFVKLNPIAVLLVLQNRYSQSCIAIGFRRCYVERKRSNSLNL
jgi:hypothetical protein